MRGGRATFPAMSGAARMRRLRHSHMRSSQTVILSWHVRRDLDRPLGRGSCDVSCCLIDLRRGVAGHQSMRRPEPLDEIGNYETHGSSMPPRKPSYPQIGNDGLTAKSVGLAGAAIVDLADGDAAC